MDRAGGGEATGVDTGPRRGLAVLRFVLLFAAAAAIAGVASTYGIAYDYGYLHAIVPVRHHRRQLSRARLAAGRPRRAEHGALTVVPTAGSIENVDRLVAAEKDCSAHFAFVQDGTPVPSGASSKSSAGCRIRNPC